MSSAAYFTIDEDTPIGREDWLAFCAEHDIRYSPSTIGRNVFYHGDTEIKFGAPNYENLPTVPGSMLLDFSKAQPPEQATEITVSTFWMGNLDGVARVAALIWLRWHGLRMSADREIKRVLVSECVIV